MTRPPVTAAGGLGLVPGAAVALAHAVARRASLIRSLDSFPLQQAVEHIGALNDGRGDLVEAAELLIGLLTAARRTTGASEWAVRAVSCALNAAMLHRRKDAGLAVGSYVARALECLAMAEQPCTVEDAA